MEWRSLIQGSITNGQVLPDPGTYGGDFSSLAKAVNVPSATTVAPSVLFKNCPGGAPPPGIVQGSPFPGNIIPTCMIDPNATSLLTAGIFPAPTSGNRFNGPSTTPTNLRAKVFGINHKFPNTYCRTGQPRLLGQPVERCKRSHRWRYLRQSLV